VYASSTGIIEKVFVSEGDTVKMGDVLFGIANPVNKFNEENARLAALLAQENLNSDKLSELLVGLELAKSKMKQDSLLNERQQILWAKKIGTKVEQESKELAFKSSKSNYLAAVYRYNDAKRQLSFLAEQSRNSFLASSSLRSDNMVKSGIDGIVYSVMREQGEIVGPQIPLGVIGDASNFFLELQVDEFDITKISIGQIVKVRLDSYKGKVFEASVIKINPIMNERSRSFFIEAVFIDRPEVLYPNLTVEANIILQEKKNALTIPRNYLIADKKVINEEGDTIVVELGLKDYEKAEVLKGLNENQTLRKP
jgi:multidrug efflux pump subunit AcrA (membrane-fusion protein)